VYNLLQVTGADILFRTGSFIYPEIHNISEKITIEKRQNYNESSKNNTEPSLRNQKKSRSSRKGKKYLLLPQSKLLTFTHFSEI
jgi:hypothetical protein